ncbi:FAD dependent oxidoreductase [Methanobacterium lacus]|uniref:FAD dependent oxidoreductase n=1 Tax=Methanobacterium lacus (strain AL-21) TaxID=877455 RepID=F0T918_METLA|nr:FAD-dependent oxidoreductase [Methanobacterium lacus]ADZ08640.1 FAD dependent oxidoreductase [Methanobacterium lacus]
MANKDLNGNSGSYWLKTCPATNFQPLKLGLKVDTVIIGGGIAGITAGILLKDMGYDVAVLESDRIVKEVTVGTTAKISVAPNMIYHDLMEKFGKEIALKIAKANKNALKKIEELVSTKGIDCEFHKTPLYIYTESSAGIKRLEEEYIAAKDLGFDVELNHHNPLPFKTSCSLKYPNQAQFHPRKYLLGLAEEIEGNGSHVFEKTRAISVHDGDVKEVVTDQGSIMASNVIIATHTPFYDPDHLKDHLNPGRSYVIGLYTRKEFPDGMFVEFNPVHTYRTTPTPKGQLVIVAGEHSEMNVESRQIYYDKLESYAKNHLDVESVRYRWSSHDSVTDDGLPMIGMTSLNAVYVATGFGFWGMNNGTTAGMVIADLIHDNESYLKDIFDPLRFKY